MSAFVCLAGELRVELESLVITNKQLEAENKALLQDKKNNELNIVGSTDGTDVVNEYAEKKAASVLEKEMVAGNIYDYIRKNDKISNQLQQKEAQIIQQRDEIRRLQVQLDSYKAISVKQSTGISQMISQRDLYQGNIAALEKNMNSLVESSVTLRSELEEAITCNNNISKTNRKLELEKAELLEVIKQLKAAEVENTQQNILAAQSVYTLKSKEQGMENQQELKTKRIKFLEAKLNELLTEVENHTKLEVCLKEEVLMLKKQVIADRALMASMSSAHEQQLNEYVLLVENKDNEISNLQEMLNERIAPVLSSTTTDAPVLRHDLPIVEKPSDVLLPGVTNHVNAQDGKADSNNKCWSCNDDLFGYVIPCATCRKEYHSICIKKNQNNVYVCSSCMT